MKQKIQTKRLAISNVGKDSGKKTKMAAWEQATRDRDRMRIVSKAKDDTNREFTSVSEKTGRSGGAIGHVDLTHSIPVEPDKG